MEDKTLHMFVDPGTNELTAAYTAAVLEGKVVTMIIVDEVNTAIGTRLHEAMEKLIEEERGTVDGFRIRDVDFGELEKRVLAMCIDDVSLDIPMKADMGPLVPKHDPHPKAKAKLPFYHQRRRY